MPFNTPECNHCFCCLPGTMCANAGSGSNYSPADQHRAPSPMLRSGEVFQAGYPVWRRNGSKAQWRREVGQRNHHWWLHYWHTSVADKDTWDGLGVWCRGLCPTPGRGILHSKNVLWWTLSLLLVVWWQFVSLWKWQCCSRWEMFKMERRWCHHLRFKLRTRHTWGAF